MDKELLARQIRAAIPPRYRQHQSMNQLPFYRCPNNAKAWDILTRWQVPTKQWLWLSGLPGTGKTSLVCAKASEVLALPCLKLEEVQLECGAWAYKRTARPGVRFAEGAELYQQWRLHQRHKYDSNGVDPLEAASSVGLLVWDDFELPEKGNEDFLRMLTSLVRRRYNDGKPTWFTSNAKLGATYTGDDQQRKAVASRIVEMVGDSWASLDGPDHRLPSRKRDQ